MPQAVKKGKAAMLKALHDRRANPPERIDNASLYAGSPLYFYCLSCGWLADTVPENYITRPARLCLKCQELKDLGWLEE